LKTGGVRMDFHENGTDSEKKRRVGTSARESAKCLGQKRD